MITPFLQEKARKAFWKYCRSPITEDFESPTTSSAESGATVTKSVNSFKTFLNNNGDDGRNVVEKKRTVQHQLQGRAIHRSKQ